MFYVAITGVVLLVLDVWHSTWAWRREREAMRRLEAIVGRRLPS